MKKIGFFYRNDAVFLAFMMTAVDLFKLWGLEGLLVKNILAGSHTKAGEFVAKEFAESDCTILVIDDVGITMPEGSPPHIAFTATTDLGEFLAKMMEFEEKTKI